MSTLGNDWKCMFCYVCSMLVSKYIQLKIYKNLSNRFLFRLYWYPLKVLYSTGVVTAYRAYGRGCGLYGFFNSLLWILLGLNIYWLFFILQFLFRVLAGTNNGLQDTREDDDEDEETT